MPGVKHDSTHGYRTTRVLAIAWSIAVAFASPSAALAQTASEPRATASVATVTPVTFYACYVPIVGTVYRIKEPGLPNQCFFARHVQFSWTDGSGSGVTDHGLLTGLADDDHPQYLLADGTRALTGDLSAGGKKLTNLGGATASGDAVRFEQAVKTGDAAGGDFGGTFPNPFLAKLLGSPLSATPPSAAGQLLTWDGTAWSAAASASGGVSDHGALTGLADDDHPQYLMANGIRALTGDLSAGGNKLTSLAAASAAGEAVRFEQAVKSGDAAGGDLSGTFPSPSVAKLQGADVAATAPASGQVLTFNGTAWAPATAASGGGVTDHGALTGLADDDHTQYLLADGGRASTNGFAVTGTYGTGAIPASGGGTRLMWYPAKAAFRAGYVESTEWDDANVGILSTAMGVNTTASGERSTALGAGTTASGNQSTAMGWITTASGLSSTAMGLSTTASGDYSTALGFSTIASGNNSTAMGADTRASGLGSTALGTNTTASGTASTTMGSNTIASGERSVAMGALASTNSHPGAFVFGDNSTWMGTNAEVRAAADNEFVVRAAGGFRFRTASDLTTGCNLPAGSGVFSCTSSRLTKENFAPLDAEAVLHKIAGLSVQGWNYRTERGVRHVGPTAEDFHGAFGLGPDSTSIGTIDAAGINMLAIQALEARTAQLKRENETLRAALARLDALVRQLGRDIGPSR